MIRWISRPQPKGFLSVRMKAWSYSRARPFWGSPGKRSPWGQGFPVGLRAEAALPGWGFWFIFPLPLCNQAYPIIRCLKCPILDRYPCAFFPAPPYANLSFKSARGLANIPGFFPAKVPMTFGKIDSLSIFCGFSCEFQEMGSA